MSYRVFEYVVPQKTLLFCIFHGFQTQVLEKNSKKWFKKGIAAGNNNENVFICFPLDFHAQNLNRFAKWNLVKNLINLEENSEFENFEAS
jgi:hypothetical protein